jgi:hypothetical protein
MMSGASESIRKMSTLDKRKTIITGAVYVVERTA